MLVITLLFKEKIFIGATLFFMVGCISVPFLFQFFFSDKGSLYFGGNETYIRTLLVLAIFSMTVLLIIQCLKKKLAFAWQTSVILLTIIIGFASNSLILRQHKFMQGGITDDHNFFALGNKTDHGLQFRFERPPNLELAVSTHEGKEINPVLQQHPERILNYNYFSTQYSNITMRDNSYNHPFNNNGFQNVHTNMDQNRICPIV